MKVLQSLILVSILVVFSACNMQQNPLDNAPESVKNGIPPEQGPQSTEKPISKEALQIDVPTLVNGRVGSPLEVIIQGRVLIPDVEFNLQIENMSQFVGATFDSTTGLFKWTPTKEILANGYIGQVELIIQLVTLPNAVGFPISMERKSITVNIVKDFAKPLVSSVTTTGNYSVGTLYSLNIVIDDVDAVTSSDLSLVFRTCDNSSYTNISTAVSFSNANFTKDPVTGKFTGTLSLDLRDPMFPYDTVNYCFSVVQFSKFGVASNPYPVYLNIKNPLKPAKVTRASIDIKKGTIAEFNFSFFDAAQVGTIQVVKLPDMTTALPGSIIKCENNLANSQIVDCKLNVDASALAVGKYLLNFSLLNYFYPQSNVDSTIAISVNVKEIL